VPSRVAGAWIRGGTGSAIVGVRSCDSPDEAGASLHRPTIANVAEHSRAASSLEAGRRRWLECSRLARGRTELVATLSAAQAQTSAHRHVG